jgi:hypothetical protein
VGIGGSGDTSDVNGMDHENQYLCRSLSAYPAFCEELAPFGRLP